MLDFFRLLERAFGWFEAIIKYLATQKDKKKIEEAKSESESKLDQRPLESLTGSSGNPTRLEYPGLQHGPAKDRSGEDTGK